MVRAFSAFRGATQTESWCCCWGHAPTSLVWSAPHQPRFRCNLCGSQSDKAAVRPQRVNRLVHADCSPSCCTRSTFFIHESQTDHGSTLRGQGSCSGTLWLLRAAQGLLSIGIGMGMDFRPPASHLRAELVRTVGGFWGGGFVFSGPSAEAARRGLHRQTANHQPQKTSAKDRTSSSQDISTGAALWVCSASNCGVQFGATVCARRPHARRWLMSKGWPVRFVALASAKSAAGEPPRAMCGTGAETLFVAATSSS